MFLENWRTNSCRRRTSVPINAWSESCFRVASRRHPKTKATTAWSELCFGVASCRFAATPKNKSDRRVVGIMFPCRFAATPKNESDSRSLGMMFRCRFAATRKKRSPTAFFGGTPKKLKNETIRSTSMSPIRKRNYVLATVFDGGVKDRRSEKKKRKPYVFKMYGRSTGYLPTYLRFCSLKYLSTD